MLAGKRAMCETEEKEATGIRKDYRSASLGESDWKRQRRNMRCRLNQES